MSENLPTLLVVDDERPIRRFLSDSLDGQYTIIEAAGGKDALRAVASEHPELIILDLGLPDMDGVEVTRRLREWTEIPIIVVSVREQESDKIAALDAGADDYLTKPFGIGELLARIRTVLRRVNKDDSEPVFTCGNLNVNFTLRTVTVGEQLVNLTPTEYDLLRVLIRHAGKVLTHRQLLRMALGNSYEDAIHILQVNISNLRHKIEQNPSRPALIITEPGVGYRLKTE
jgi:two-component system KDP operon response regulator KdpE